MQPDTGSQNKRYYSEFSSDASEDVVVRYQTYYKEPESSFS